MTNRSTEARFDGYVDRIKVQGRVLPYESGELPEDFLHRLRALKKASGLTWSAFADAIGVGRKQMRRWRKEGVEPAGGAMHSLFRFASRIKGGLDILMGDGFQMDLWEEDDDHEDEES